MNFVAGIPTTQQPHFAFEHQRAGTITRCIRRCLGYVDPFVLRCGCFLLRVGGACVGTAESWDDQPEHDSVHRGEFLYQLWIDMPRVFVPEVLVACVSTARQPMSEPMIAPCTTSFQELTSAEPAPVHLRRPISAPSIRLTTSKTWAVPPPHFLERHSPHGEFSHAHTDVSSGTRERISFRQAAIRSGVS